MEIDHFLIQDKSISPDKSVHQMARHLSYTHANLSRVTTVAKVVKHSRPVLVVDIKHTHGSPKRALKLLFYMNRAIKHILIDIL